MNEKVGKKKLKDGVDEQSVRRIDEANGKSEWKKRVNRRRNE